MAQPTAGQRAESASPIKPPSSHQRSVKVICQTVFSDAIHLQMWSTTPRQAFSRMAYPRQATPRSGTTSRRFTSRPHWSYSQLSQYLRCPLQFYFERVIKLQRPFSPSSMALGSAVHEGLAEYHRQLMADRKVTTGQVQSTFLKSWSQQERERPIQYRDGESRNQIIEQGVALLEVYQNEPPPENILAVEERMIVPLTNSQGQFLEKPLVAVIDLLSHDEDELLVTEFKTSGRRYHELEADTTLQASCYANAVRERYDRTPKVRYTVLVKTKTPAVQNLVTTRTDADLGRLGDVVQAVELAITAEAFYPIESTMNCSGCPFFKPCREWRGGRAKPSGNTDNDQHHEVSRC